MLPSELLKKVKLVHIRTGRVVDTIFAGQYKSAFRGQGMEFEEFRDYSPGDDIKRIDWKVSARMGRPYVKIYREERELNIMLLVDLSGSLEFGTGQGLKKDTALEAAAVLAFSAIRNNDKIGAIFFTDKVEKYLPPKKGASHVWRIIKEIVSFRPESRGTDLGAALEFMGRVMRKRSVGFIISDFLSPDYSRPMRIVSGRHELIGVRVADAGDARLPKAGFVQARDLETGVETVLDCSSKAVRRAYEGLVRQRIDQARSRLAKAKVEMVDISTDQSVSDSLGLFFRKRESRLK